MTMREGISIMIPPFTFVQCKLRSSFTFVMLTSHLLYLTQIYSISCSRCSSLIYLTLHYYRGGSGFR